ncbi:hypothetical protein CC80DRAFT_544355 [Byssothecium circinans]|uniref:Uncharacterized protein n=1 Tax=Byssothecium circinans TaxID=147558 RepID=A0A6A5UAI8_9PLEO|nr:hypothetical protein CC80DRAFT_544355 [Byssothecium circinans]
MNLLHLVFLIFTALASSPSVDSSGSSGTMHIPPYLLSSSPHKRRESLWSFDLQIIENCRCTSDQTCKASFTTDAAISNVTYPSGITLPVPFKCSDNIDDGGTVAIKFTGDIEGTVRAGPVTKMGSGTVHMEYESCKWEAGGKEPAQGDCARCVLRSDGSGAMNSYSAMNCGGTRLRTRTFDCYFTPTRGLKFKREASKFLPAVQGAED